MIPQAACRRTHPPGVPDGCGSGGQRPLAGRLHPRCLAPLYAAAATFPTKSSAVAWLED